MPFPLGIVLNGFALATQAVHCRPYTLLIGKLQNYAIVPLLLGASLWIHWSPL